MEKYSKPEKTILDTNFLLSIVRLKIGVFEEMKNKGIKKFYVLSKSLDELKKLSENKRIEKEVNVINELIKKEKIIILKSTGIVDDELVEKSQEFFIATNDSALRKRIKSFAGKSIYIRNKAYIQLE
jgi:rRNA-processing protein FCF1